MPAALSLVFRRKEGLHLAHAAVSVSSLKLFQNCLSVCVCVCVCVCVWGKTCRMGDIYINRAKRNGETRYSHEITFWIASFSSWKQRLLLIVQTSGPLEITASLLVYLQFR